MTFGYFFNRSFTRQSVSSSLHYRWEYKRNVCVRWNSSWFRLVKTDICLLRISCWYEWSRKTELEILYSRSTSGMWWSKYSFGLEGSLLMVRLQTYHERSEIVMGTSVLLPVRTDRSRTCRIPVWWRWMRVDWSQVGLREVQFRIRCQDTFPNRLRRFRLYVVFKFAAFKVVCFEVRTNKNKTKSFAQSTRKRPSRIGNVKEELSTIGVFSFDV